MHSFYKNKKPGKQRVFRKRKVLKKGSGGVGGPRRRKNWNEFSVENAESAGKSGERELVDRVRARGRQNVEVFGRVWRRGCASVIRVRKGVESV